MPSLEERRPDLAARAVESSTESLEAVGGEGQLDWFREDPLANQHHEHWHVVYPVGGVPDGRGGATGKDRQGELFFYMHQQMLARYDAERIAAGLGPVKPFATYTTAIAEGYDSGLPDFRARSANRKLATVDLGGGAYSVQDHTRAARPDQRVVDSGASRTGPRSTPTRWGRGRAERAARRADRVRQLPRLRARPDRPRGGPARPSRPGVMWTTATAIMDPAFYRWHRHIDDQLARWQEKQPPHDFSDAPPAAAKPPLLVFSDTVPQASRSGAALQTWAKRTFGGTKWGTRSTARRSSTPELETGTRTRSTPAGPLEYLDHRDFLYVLRLENTRAQPTDVTVRVFLAPASAADNRRTWIEMDKFHQRLAAREKAVVARPGALSSVVQKPAVRPPRPRRDPSNDPKAAENYCNCGWPFHLLVPRGTPEGMPFRLFVMLTDWNADRVSEDAHCGSMSFCGVRDCAYPDRRAMGYPFDRPLPRGTTLDAVVAGQPNMSLRDVSIRFRGRL